MEKYEKNIGLKSIWLIFVRRLLVVLAVFVPISLATIIYTQGIMKKTYSSSVRFTNSSPLDQNGYSSIVNTVKKESTITQIVNNLANKESPIILNNETILSGLQFSSYSVSSQDSITISFQSANSSIVKPVATELASVAIEEIKTIGFNNMTASIPTDASMNSKNNTYLWIGLGAGAVLALGFAFVYEIISDEVYDKDDIEKLGSSGFEFTISK